jgi:hypothetical protein
MAAWRPDWLAEVRKQRARRHLEDLLGDRSVYIREAAGREPVEAEMEPILDIAWRAARHVMLEGSRAIQAERVAGREAAAERERAHRRKLARARRKRKKAGPAAVPFPAVEGLP